jgi:hypothetical protein
MSATWKTARVFISSTFRDMHAERDHLVKVTFPRLRQWCEERRLHLVDINLRWGVTREEADNGKAIEICLGEIDGSRPFFVCLLGGRYGWVPEHLPPEAPERFRGLQARTHCSITHLEIIHATEEPLNTVPTQQPDLHAFFYFRAPECLPHPDALTHLTAEQREAYRHTFFEQHPRPATALDNLKQGLWRRYEGQGRVFEYTGTWDAYAGNPEDDRLHGRLTRLEALGERVEQDLCRPIALQFRDHLAALADSDPLAEERSLHAAFIENRTQVHVPRTEVEARISRHVEGDDPRPLVLSGPPGGGKSSVLAHWVATRLRHETPGLFVLARFVGASPASTNLQRLLGNLGEELVRHFGLTEEITLPGGATAVRPMEVPADPVQLREKWPRLLEEAGKRGRVLLVLDALNQLDRSADPQRLDWLPLRLPPGVRIAVSALDHGEASRPEQPTPEDRRPDWLACLRRAGFVGVPVPALTDDDRRRIIRELPSVFCKTLDDSQVSLLLENQATRNPLFLTVALEELRVFGAFEKLPDAIRALPRLDADGQGDIDHALDALFGRVLERLEQETERQAPGLVAALFRLLASAREGLAEEELQGVLARKLPGLPEAERNGAVQVVLRQVRRYLMRKGLRPREGGVHRGGGAEGRPLRACRRRHPVPGRNRREPAGPAAEAAAGLAGTGVRAPGRHADAAGQRPAGGGDEPRPGEDGRRGAVPQRPVLPAQRLPADAAAFTSAAGGRAAAGALLRAAARAAAEAARREHPRRGDDGADALPVAGKRARAGELHRAERAAVARPSAAGGGRGVEATCGFAGHGGDDAGRRRARAHPGGAAADELGDRRAVGGGGAAGDEADDADLAHAEAGHQPATVTCSPGCRFFLLCHRENVTHLPQRFCHLGKGHDSLVL